MAASDRLITLLRHGRTEANAAGLLQGRIDNPLDDEGRRQAAAAAHALGPVDEVVSSPLRRATETASAFGRSFAIDERWTELDYGEWDGQPVRDIPSDVWERWRSDLTLRPPGGETLLELGARVRAALEDLARGRSGEHVVVVSHVSPIKAAAAWALGVGDEVGWRTHLTTGSYSQICVRGPHRALVSFNVVPTPAAAQQRTPGV